MIPPCVVCVAPVGGRARALVELGRWVEPGQAVAVVDADGGSTVVRAPAAGRVGGWLGGAHLVHAGEAVLWLSR